jgi:hypothetical protein
VDDDSILPQIISYETGTLPQDGISLMIRYASSQEQIDSRKWDVLTLGMDRKIAIDIARALLRASGELPLEPKAVRH